MVKSKIWLLFPILPSPFSPSPNFLFHFYHIKLLKQVQHGGIMHLLEDVALNLHVFETTTMVLPTSKTLLEAKECFASRRSALRA